MEENTLSRKEREKLRQRNEILEAAQVLFSHRGYHHVSMQEIAEASEFAVGTLYNYFKNKQELYKALVRKRAKEVNHKLRNAILSSDNEINQLRCYVKAKCDHYKTNVDGMRLYLAETRVASFNFMAGLDGEIGELKYKTRQILAGVFEKGIANNRFKKRSNPYHLAVSLESISNAFLLLWLEDPERNPYPENPDTILSIILEGLIDA